MRNYIFICALFLAGCSQRPDFTTFPKIDAHAHLVTSDDSFVEVLKENSFLLMSLVTRSVSQPLIEEEFNYARDLYKEHPASIAFATTFSMDGFGEPGWEERTIEWLKGSFDDGAIAVKVWKDIGMTFLDKDSSYFADHPQYHMYLHPDAPSHRALIAARDHVLEKHPDLRVVGCHLGSLEYDVDEQSRRFD